ncbi:MAG: GNAT family N-acetyltransferase [Acidimicrobiia bacterium]
MPWTQSLPNGYVGSVGAPTDLSELQALVATVDTMLEGTSTMTVDTLETSFGEPDFDRTRHVALVHSNDGKLVGAAWFNLIQPFVASFAPGYVHPDYEGLGIGGSLTEWLIAAAHANESKAPDDTRVTLAVGIHDSNERAKRLFSARGFEVERYFLEMEIALGQPISIPPLAEGLTLRTMSPDEDVDALSAAVTGSFKDHYGFTERPPEVSNARWRQWRTSEVWDDDLVWLAMADDRIVGVNVCLRTHGAREDQGYVASLGVLPDWRGKGLARHLLTTSFAEYQSRGMDSVALHVDADSLTGATRLYEGVGMHETQRTVDFQLEIRAGRDITVR